MRRDIPLLKELKTWLGVLAINIPLLKELTGCDADIRRPQRLTLINTDKVQTR
jgi:hypothetical protein